MSQLYCVRAEFGKFTDYFIKGGYVAIGGYSNEDLSSVNQREELEDIHSSISPNDGGNIRAGQQMDQVARFLLDLKPGDFVVTPSLNTEFIYYGVVQPEPYFYELKKDRCPFPHRKRVIWSTGPIRTKVFSDQFQHSLHSSLSIFPINQKENFFDTINSSSFQTA